MQNPPVYHMTGNSFFKKGQSIYINKVVEEAKPHLHCHDFLEVAYVASGSGIHRIGDREFTVSKGDLFIINYNVAHEFRSLSLEPGAGLVVYNCVFNPDFLDYSLVNCRDFSDITHHFLFRAFFPEEGSGRSDIHLNGLDRKGIEELYEKMLSEYALMENGYIEILRAYVIELLITVFRAFRKSKRLDEGIENSQTQIIKKVMLYIKENYSREIKLEDLSVMAFLSRNYFCRLFREVTNMTVVEYAQKIRIEEACRLLRETDRKIIDIAADVGYRDIKFFNQVFKRKTGLTPGRYRKKQTAGYSV